ncbi:MAG: enoyl-CoA hydratase/isomerase family protein [Gammaproteobacteria bacterium]|nr:enoyl-CoA hydratase/isomerase family protein [Gammaproteobacteria bacterium]
MGMPTGKFSGFEVSMNEPGIAWFEFNTPERLNGMTTAIKRDLIEAMTHAQMNDDVRVLVFTGQGRGFCAGDDLKAYKGTELGGTPLVQPIPPGHHNALGTYNGLRAISQALNTSVRNLDKITIAAINGVAIQTGLSLALSCDFRIASESARLGSATLRFGLLPDEGGQFLLVQLLGLSRALDFVMRKRIVTATEAHDLGLIHEVVAPEALRSTALAWAREFANGPQVSMRLLKRSLYNAAEQTWPQALDDIAAKTAISDHHPDVKEGVGAFHEKRKPRFNAWLERK